MKVDLDGIDPEVAAAYLAGLERVKRAQKRTVADYWYVGSALKELRAIVSSLPGVKWYEVYGKTGLGFSESTEWRYRELARLYDTAEAAGQYTSVSKALRAKGENPTVCPGWSPKDSDEERAAGCNGKKTAQYRFCVPCTAAWAKDEKADAKARRVRRQHRARLLKAAVSRAPFELPGGLPEETVEQAMEVIQRAMTVVSVNEEQRRQLKEAYRLLESKERTIGRYAAELVDCHERLQMVEQRSIPMNQFSPTVGETDWPAVTA